MHLIDRLMLITLSLFFRKKKTENVLKQSGFFFHHNEDAGATSLPSSLGILFCTLTCLLFLCFLRLLQTSHKS